MTRAISQALVRAVQIMAGSEVDVERYVTTPFYDGLEIVFRNGAEVTDFVFATSYFKKKFHFRQQAENGAIFYNPAESFSEIVDYCEFQVSDGHETTMVGGSQLWKTFRKLCTKDTVFEVNPNITSEISPRFGEPFNLYSGFIHNYKFRERDNKGLEIFLRVLSANFTNNAEELHWALAWLAAIIRGEEPPSPNMLTLATDGAGKSLFAFILVSIIPHSTRLHFTDICYQAYRNKTLLLMDEVPHMFEKKEQAKLKTLSSRLPILLLTSFLDIKKGKKVKVIQKLNADYSKDHEIWADNYSLLLTDATMGSIQDYLLAYH